MLIKRVFRENANLSIFLALVEPESSYSLIRERTICSRHYLGFIGRMHKLYLTELYQAKTVKNNSIVFQCHNGAQAYKYTQKEIKLLLRLLAGVGLVLTPHRLADEMEEIDI